MRTGISFTVSAGERQRLQAIVAAPWSPQKHVWRARIALLSADGLGTSAIMAETNKSKTCGGAGRSVSCKKASMVCFATVPPTGTAPVASDRVADIIRLTLSRHRTGDPLDVARHGEGRRRRGVDGMQAIWRPRPSARIAGGSSASNDPALPRSCDHRRLVRRSAGPRRGAVVDEKSQIQALDRTQPGLPMKTGRAGTMTHDYKRHGTTTLFAALNVLDGTVIGQNMQRHRHQEFIRFLNRIEREVPPDKAIHVVLDNYAAHKKDTRSAPARPPSTLDLPLHPDLVLVAQCRRRLLRQTHPPPAQARRLPFRRRPSGRHHVCDRT